MTARRNARSVVARTCVALLSALVLGAPAVVVAQPRTLSPAEAIALAWETHPDARAAGARASVRDAELRAVEAALLPRVDLGLELHRATGNVAPGTQLALPSVPTVSGPPLPVQFDTGVWGTGIGAGVGLDVGALPARDRERHAASEARIAAGSVVDAVRLEIAVRVVRAYLDVVLAREQRASIAAWHARASALMTLTETLAAQSLQPGADVARARAEVAAAAAFDARAHQAERVARIALASAIGDASIEVEVDVAILDEPNDERDILTEVHALEAARRAELESARSTRDARRLGYLPRIELMGALWARGSGIDAPSRASDLGDAAGLVPNVPNWSVGLVVSYALFDLPLLDARAAEAEARVEEASAALDAQVLELQALEAGGLARLEGAREVVAATLEVVGSYQAALAQTNARFEAGLTTVLDVVDAQRALAQAQFDHAAARVELVRAFYDLAYARGDLRPFQYSTGD